MIETIAYSHEADTLWVKFKPTGECYFYLGVTVEHADILCHAEDHETYLNCYIKRRYQGEKGHDFEFDVFCKILLSELSVVPMAINWSAVRAAADHMVWC